MACCGQGSEPRPQLPCRPPQEMLALVLLPTPKLNQALACCSEATTAASAARVDNANLFIVLALSDISILSSESPLTARAFLDAQDKPPLHFAHFPKEIVQTS